MWINLYDIKDGGFVASLRWNLPLPQKGDKMMVHGLDGVFGVEVDSRVFDDERDDMVTIMIKCLNDTK